MKKPATVISVLSPVFKVLRRIREDRRKKLGLPSLSWTQFFAIIAKELGYEVPNV